MLSINVKELPMKAHYFFYYGGINFLPVATSDPKERYVRHNISIPVEPHDFADGFCSVPLSLLNTTLEFMDDISCNLSCIPGGARQAQDVQSDSVEIRVDVNEENVTFNALADLQNLSGVCFIRCSFSDQRTTFPSGSVLLNAVFWLYCVFVTINYAAIGCANSLTDTACFELLSSDEADAKNRFGLHRLWGTVGWGVFAAGSGYLIDALKAVDGTSVTATDYSAGFYVAVALVIVDAVCVCICDIRKSKSSKNNRQGHVLARLQGHTSMVSAPGCHSGWRIRRHRVAVPLLVPGPSGGLFGADGCFGGCEKLAELPVFVCAGWAIGKAGHVFVLRAALVSMATSFALYSVISNPWVTLPVELLLGLALGAFFTAIPSYAEEVAPPGTEATTMGLVMGFFEGIGTALGGLSGGAGFEWLGGSTTFQLVALVGFAWCLLAYALDASLARISRPVSRCRRARRPKRGANILDFFLAV
ncbi:hypothetical protein HPB48_017692 [Haemaphysalis longicornis]|uniref:Major facilitator superfamily associated domain-containing protein n=1 Tax=Haemaphysalis longicornis TaxID=44386 RepID=A0A9J6FYC7_HAELO|nr:hypothetical protein HPB48_017692 [Haemaphysalis longicornis]